MLTNKVVELASDNEQAASGLQRSIEAFLAVSHSFLVDDCRSNQNEGSEE